MRRFMDKRVMVQAVIAGAVTACLCLPYLRAHSANPLLLQLRVAFLIPVAILLFQSVLAWTPLAGGRSAAAPPEHASDWLWILPATVALAGIRLIWLDPRLEALRPGYLPATWAAWGGALPWMVLFQPLTLIAGVYAFAARFTRSPAIGIAAIVAVRLAAVWAQWPDQPSAMLALFLATGGAGALLIAWIYRTGSLPALFAAMLILECRHVIRLLNP